MTTPYRRLLGAIAINTLVMFGLTYAMIAELGHFYVNINRVYMALMMASPMVVVMLALMPGMYQNRTLNLVLYAASALVFFGCFALARTQTPVGNRQFLRSMIPHHSSAIVMCEQSSLTGAEILALCDQIVRAQNAEIAQMKTMLQHE